MPTRGDVVERLRGYCVDWNGAPMDRGEAPRDGLHCGDLMEAAAEIERLRAALTAIHDFPYVGAQASVEIQKIARCALLGRTENEQGNQDDAG